MIARATVAVVFLFALVAGLAVASRSQFLGMAEGLALDVVAPIERLMRGSFQATGAARGVGTVDELVRENQRLKAEVDRLARDAVRAPELQRDNDQLRELLNLRKNGVAFQWLDANVIAFDSSNLVRSVTIDRGERDGLVDGMTVMAPRGLVGRIVKLGRTSSRVLLITDASATVNGMVQRTRARGVLVGQRAGSVPALAMRYIPQGEELKVGDVVISSGLGGIFPEGIPIGQVSQVRQRDTDMFQEATVDPAVDFTRLETVFVVTSHLPVKLD